MSHPLNILKGYVAEHPCYETHLLVQSHSWRNHCMDENTHSFQAPFPVWSPRDVHCKPLAPALPKTVKNLLWSFWLCGGLVESRTDMGAKEEVVQRKTQLS